MITMAIDASSKSTGVAIYDNKELIYYKCITETSLDSLTRIEKMTSEIRILYDKYQVNKVIMEDVIPEDVRHNQQVFKILHYLQASIVLELHKSKQTVEFYVSSEWRKLCGFRTGRGITRDVLKKASMDFVKNKYNLEVNDDIADAICIGWAYTNQNSTGFQFK